MEQHRATQEGAGQGTGDQLLRVLFQTLCHTPDGETHREGLLGALSLPVLCSVQDFPNGYQTDIFISKCNLYGNFLYVSMYLPIYQAVNHMCGDKALHTNTAITHTSHPSIHNILIQKWT